MSARRLTQHRGRATDGALGGLAERACDPSLHEPNMSLDLEIADIINQKKANTSVPLPARPRALPPR